MPAAVAKEQDYARATGVEQHEFQNVAKPWAWVGHEQRRHDMEGREDQRLRIGNLRPAGENVRRPERRLTGCERAGEERQLRIKLRGGVVGDFDRAGEPGPAEGQKGNAVEAKRPREREPLSLPKIPRHYPGPGATDSPCHLYNENGRPAPPASSKSKAEHY